RRPSRTLNLGARIEHALTKTHTLRAEYQRNAVRQDNLGVGDFSLFDRAYTSDTTEHLVRAVDSGLLTEKLVNEVRFQARWQSASARSASNAPALQVLNAFTRGGAGLDSDRAVSEYELGDNIDFAYKQHTMRAGLLAEVGRYQSRDARNANGTFTFASLDAFRHAAPTTYTQRAGDARVAHTQYQLGAYWQDDWRARKNLTLSFGLRYEWQNHLRDQNNFAPRLGFAWSPFKRGPTLRGGAGLFYDWFAADTYEQTLRVNAARQRETVISAPGYPDPFAGGSAVVLPASRYLVAPDLRLPYVAQASVGVEHDLWKRFRVMSDYRFQRGVHLLRGRNVNAPFAGLGRPDPTAGNVIQVESSANSTRHEW
ncbi:MAG TPA: TonB-dependent receptor, partial [Pyrinomonadaceae bacterium]|nr:TonB-dependent receptor [Pyrinomonadaceae bacterium]